MTENIVIKTAKNHKMGIVNLLLGLCGQQDLLHSFFPSLRIDATSKNRVSVSFFDK